MREGSQIMEDAVKGLETTKTSLDLEPCFFSLNVGVSFTNTNAVAKNTHIQEFLESDSDGAAGVTIGETETRFSINTFKLGHFLHMVYANTPEGRKLRVDFDGIFPFDAKDEISGSMKKFNAQLITISEVDE